MAALIEFTDKGLFCRRGGFYIDPWRPVERAVITHGHSDHARFGSGYYLCHTDTKPILQLRLGDNVYETLPYNQVKTIGDVQVSLHPAGHIIGSAQVRIECDGEVWVVSGDYKTENDGISGEFEPVKCHTFISESTFGLPIYKWEPQQKIYDNIRQWITENQADGAASVLIAYSLGKAQRVLDAVKDMGLPIFVHGAIWNVHETLTNAGWKLPVVQRVMPDMPKDTFKNSIIIAPPSADSTPWMKRFQPHATGICSGWMQVRGNVRRRNADAGFSLSDHADWPGLISAVKATGATKVFVTHGFQSAFSRFLTENGIEAGEVKTEYGEDEDPGLTNPETATEEMLTDD